MILRLIGIDACDAGEKEEVGREGITTVCPREPLDGLRERDRAKLAKVPMSLDLVSWMRMGSVGGRVGRVEGRTSNGMEKDLSRRGFPVDDVMDEKMTMDTV
jgi:hypothetical protein